MKAIALTKNNLLIKDFFETEEIGKNIILPIKIKTFMIKENHKEEIDMDLSIVDIEDKNVLIRTDYNLPEMFKILKTSNVDVDTNGIVTLNIVNYKGKIQNKLNKPDMIDIELLFINKILKWGMNKC